MTDRSAQRLQPSGDQQVHRHAEENHKQQRQQGQRAKPLPGVGPRDGNRMRGVEIVDQPATGLVSIGAIKIDLEQAGEDVRSGRAGHERVSPLGGFIGKNRLGKCLAGSHSDDLQPAGLANFPVISNKGDPRAEGVDARVGDAAAHAVEFPPSREPVEVALQFCSTRPDFRIQ